MIDWREFVEAAKTDFESGLQALERAQESRLLVDWAVAYGPRLVEGFKLLATAVQSADDVRVVDAKVACDLVEAGHEQDDAERLVLDVMRINRLYHEAAEDAHDFAMSFLRGVGRE